MKKELVKLANHLDNIGHGDLADRLDDILKSAQSSAVAPTDKEIDALKVQFPRHDGEDDRTWNQRLRNSWIAQQNLDSVVLEQDPNPGGYAEPDVNQYGEDAKGQVASDEPPSDEPPPAPKQTGTKEEILEADDADKEARLAEVGDEAGKEAFDQVFAANSAQERIDKLAELMSGEFTTYTPGTFSR